MENKIIPTIDIKDKQSYYNIGYILNKKYHWKVYVKEALKGLFNDLYNKTNIKEVIIKVNVDNISSNKLDSLFGNVFKIETMHVPKFDRDDLFNI